MTKPPDLPPEKVFEDFQQIFADFFGTKSQARGGADLRLPLRISLGEAARGVARTIEVPRWTPCAMCRGEGGQPGATQTRCNRCQGSGKLARAQGSFRVATACEECKGRGSTWSRECGVCDGRGGNEVASKLTVTVPPGVRPGHKLRLKGQGRAPASVERSADGSQTPEPSGAPGHLYLDVEIDLPRGTTIEGDDLVVRTRVAPSLAMRGGELAVPWIDGDARVQVPAGTAHDARIAKRGWGLGRTGVPFAPPPTDDGAPYRSSESDARGDLVVVILLHDDPEALLARELAATPAGSRATIPVEARLLAAGLASLALALGYWLLSR